MRSFNSWRSCIDSLAERGSKLAPLRLDSDKLDQVKVLKALCSLETTEVSSYSNISQRRMWLDG